MNVEQFKELMVPLADVLNGKTLHPGLSDELDEAFPADGDAFKEIERACFAAIDAGWMCSQGDEGRKFGRVIEPCPELHNFSVDVVDLKDIVGPFHRHPTGEVCMIMPVDENAKFDGKGRGWKVFKPGSAHPPTVKDGRALVLYLLPNGEIEFMKPPKKD